MKRITARHRQAVDLVVNEGRTMASVGREFGVTARTVRRWIDAIYPPPPSQEMTTMDGSRIRIVHEYGSKFPQRYRDLNYNQRRKLCDEYVEYFKGRCPYCNELLDNEPHEFVRQSADEIDWDTLPGGKEGFLKNPVHLHHDHKTGLALAAVHAMCNAHSWHSYEVLVQMQQLIEKVESMSAEERKAFAERMRKRFG
ncbi:MAG: sigma factor-like helix-turn-helix DNA-binding protein [Woeseiaceae bacterium]|nr:sigma factor-like helix-turn-helix DNA-binding protein [Woeseiaceae bacterium]